MAPGVSWDSLRVFIVVYRAGSFSAAADELGVAQSSVSEQMARLERDLGYRLVERGPTGVRPTERGAELAARIAEPIDAMLAATHRHEHGDKPRTVFLGGPAEFLSEAILPGLVGRLSSDVRLVTQFGLAEALLDDLRAGGIDVLISSLPARGTDLRVEPIYDEEFVLVAHPNWARLAEEELDSIPVLAYGSELPIIRRYWRSVFERPPSNLTASVIAPDLRTLLRLTLGGAGMTVLPNYLVRDHVRSKALVELHTPEVAPLNTLYVATRKPHSRPDPAVATVRAAIVEAARALR